jgi:hypothetical protein
MRFGLGPVADGDVVVRCETLAYRYVLVPERTFQYGLGEFGTGFDQNLEASSLTEMGQSVAKLGFYRHQEAACLRRLKIGRRHATTPVEDDQMASLALEIWQPSDGKMGRVGQDRTGPGDDRVGPLAQSMR